jgi:hypothetical protein
MLRGGPSGGGIKIGKTEPAGLYLGCTHVISDRTLPGSGVKVRTMEYDMEDFMRSCVKVYLELFPKAPPFRTVSTPCWPEDHKDAEAAKQAAEAAAAAAAAAEAADAEPAATEA